MKCSLTLEGSPAALAAALEAFQNADDGVSNQMSLPLHSPTVAQTHGLTADSITGTAPAITDINGEPNEAELVDTDTDAALAITDTAPTILELDSNGLPWDERIHASTRNTNKDGSWEAAPGRRRRPGCRSRSRIAWRTGVDAADACGATHAACRCRTSGTACAACRCRTSGAADPATACPAACAACRCRTSGAADPATACPARCAHPDARAVFAGKDGFCHFHGRAFHPHGARRNGCGEVLDR